MIIANLSKYVVLRCILLFRPISKSIFTRISILLVLAIFVYKYPFDDIYAVTYTRNGVYSEWVASTLNDGTPQRKHPSKMNMNGFLILDGVRAIHLCYRLLDSPSPKSLPIAPHILGCTIVALV